MASGWVILLALQSALCFLLPLVAWVNLRFLRRTPRRKLGEAELPFVSICVPARNEAANIERCVRSLMAQRYPRLEILVLDDCSEDETGRIVGRLVEEAPGRVRLMGGRPLPEGWVGKVHACHQLSEAARGERMLFTDADTEFHPECIRYAVEVAEAKGADLLTGVPRLVAVGFWEHQAVPLLAAAAGSLLPLPWIERPGLGLAAGGSGAFLFFRRGTYAAIGGHAGIRGEIVEDLKLCRAVKAAGFRVGVADLASYVSCRMYRSLPEVWEGFSKNMFAAVGMNVTAFIAVGVLVAALWLTPWVWLVAGLALGGEPGWLIPVGLAQIIAVTGARYATDRLVGTPSWWAPLLTPFSALFCQVIGAHSAGDVLLRRRTAWRGRHYDLWKLRGGGK